MKFTKDKEQVLRDGEAIGTYDAETKTVHLKEPLAPVLKGQLRNALETAGFDVDEFVIDEIGSETPNSDEAKPVKAAIGEIPPCPPYDPNFGDKTPAVVEWYREHRPDEFATKYAGRKTHLG